MTFEDKLKKKIETESDKRSKRQNSTANEHLDKAVSWYLGVGYETGANLLAPLLVECYELFAEIKRAKSSGADVYGFADDVKFDAEDMIQKLESFVKDGQDE